jgi:hypothetical protein
MSAFAAAAAAPRVAAPRRVSETRAVRASRTRVAAMSPSMPVAPELPLPDFLREPFKQVAERLEEALPADAKKQVLRAQYTSAVGLRLAFFLSQGVLSSRVSGSSNIDGAAAAAAIVKAVLDPEPRARVPDAESNLGNIVRNAADGRALSEAEAAEVSQFLEQHLTCIVNLFRDELEHLENGVYKFPYDLNPATAPSSQWNPVDVLALSRDTLSDQSDVSKRRDSKARPGAPREVRARPGTVPGVLPAELSLSNRRVALERFRAAVRFPSRDSVFRVRGHDEKTGVAVCFEVREYVSRERTAETNGAGLNVLDVASGTGRFLTFPAR